MTSIRSDLSSFLRDLRSRNASANTYRSYKESIEQLAAYVERHQLPSDPRLIQRETVESYISDVLSKNQPNTAATRFRACKAFFQYLEKEGELTSPMGGMRTPTVPEVPPTLLDDGQLRELVKSCDDSFIGRRDEAILRILIDGGPRRSELSNVTVQDLDLDRGHIWVTGKGRRRRRVPLTDGTVRALDRYLRRRADHPQAKMPWLWLGQRGRLTDSGLAQVVYSRGQEANLKIKPHLLRHVAAHRFLSNGGREGDLMQLMGWRTRMMLNRYGASLASDRALAAFRDLDLAI